MEDIITIEAYSKEKEERAFIEFLALIDTGKVPKDSMFFSGTMTISSSDKTYEEIPIQLVVLPDKKHKLLKSSTNADWVMQEFPKFSDNGIRISLEGKTKQMSFDDEGRILVKNLKLKLIPDDDGTVLRHSEDDKTIMRITQSGFVIEDWQKFMEDPERYSMIVLAKKSNFTLTNVIKTEVFSKFTDRLADGEFPAGTSFVFRIIYPKGEEMKRKMEATAFLPDGTKEDLTGLTEFFTELTNRGVTVMVSESGTSIDIPNLQRCPECGEKFAAKKSDQVYCGDKCRNKHNQRLWRQRQKKKRHKQI